MAPMSPTDTQTSASTDPSDYPLPTTAPVDPVTQGFSTLSKGSKIGIALGIAATIFLTLLALLIVGLDFRKRHRRRIEERRRRTRESEMSAWEAELKRSQQNEVTRKVEISGPVGGVVGGREWEWLPAYMPRGRASIGSIPLPPMPPGRSFFEGSDERRKI